MTHHDDTQKNEMSPCLFYDVSVAYNSDFT